MLPPLPPLRLVPAHDLGPVTLVYDRQDEEIGVTGRAATAHRLVHLASLWALVGVGIGLALAVLAPLVVGGRSLTVMSGSMAPTLLPGDVVVALRMSAHEARIGDVVTFKDPKGSGKLISHRVRKTQATADGVRFTTRGDANTSVERWTIDADGTIGRVAYRIPKLGYLAAWASNPAGRILLIVLPVLLLGALELKRIWAPGEEAGNG